MDFDDLDDVAPIQVTDSPPRSPRAKESKPERYRAEEYLPPIPRSFRLPDFNDLPPVIEKLLPEQGLHLKARPKVLIRAFVFYGAGDTWYAWAQLAATAPPYCEVAVHEWPSHGQRSEEDAPQSLDQLANDAFKAVKAAMDQHAKGGRCEGAPFVLIGHSIGCLLVTALAAKLRKEMQLEPAAVVMLDRAAPEIPLHSEFGCKMRDENPWDFMRDYNAMVYNTAKKSSGEKGEKMIKMWVDDVRIGSDTRPLGFHQFECDLLLLKAMDNIGIELLKASDNPEQRKEWAAREPLMGSPPGWAMDCSPEQYELWKAWTNKTFISKDIKASHITIKSNQQALDTIWELMKEKRALEPAAK